MKLSFLIFSVLVVIANAAPVQDDLVIAAVGDIVGVHDRETRSSAKEPDLPWHLDRIDQRRPHLDGQYNPFAKGIKLVKYICKHAE